MRIRTLLRLIVSLLLSLPQWNSFAQDVVEPGSPGLLTQVVQPYHVTYRFTMVQEERKLDIGPFVDELRVIEKNEGKLFVRVQNIGNGRLIDTAIAKATTLEPIYHSGRNRGGTLVLNFSGMSVKGQKVVQPGDSVIVIDQTLSQKLFDSNLYDLVVRFLPLKEGYRARIPTYIFEQGGLSWYDVAVKGSERVGADETWVVESVHGKVTVTFWIDKQSRELLKYYAVTGQGVDLIRERM